MNQKVCQCSKFNIHYPFKCSWLNEKKKLTTLRVNICLVELSLDTLSDNSILPLLNVNDAAHRHRRLPLVSGHGGGVQSARNVGCDHF